MKAIKIIFFALCIYVSLFIFVFLLSIFDGGFGFYDSFILSNQVIGIMILVFVVIYILQTALERLYNELFK